MVEVKGIVRVKGQDMPGTVRIYRALTRVKGIGDQTARGFAMKFCQENKLDINDKIGTLSEEQLKQLDEMITEPKKFGFPVWLLNKRKDYDSGEDLHLTMAKLQLDRRNIIKRLAMIKSYRGLRLQWGLTVRGQRTKASFRQGGKKARYRKNKSGKSSGGGFKKSFQKAATNRKTK
ncbi:MAG: 30S ribosomal protein S13 [Candidatus Diapherotrites archaeon]|nr:30S ribosomal protein S13 [Candidatus Diapherotrites archaeon]